MSIKTPGKKSDNAIYNNFKIDEKEVITVFHRIPSFIIPYEHFKGKNSQSAVMGHFRKDDMKFVLKEILKKEIKK